MSEAAQSTWPSGLLRHLFRGWLPPKSDLPTDPQSLRNVVRRRDAEDIAQGIRPNSSMVWRTYTGANVFPWMGNGD